MSKKKSKSGLLAAQNPMHLILPGIFVFCLVFHFYFAIQGWDHLLTERHGFRQTQTAISTFYTLKEGFRLDYITPVFGKPWSIPMEFPIYQWIVASVVLITKMGLDQAGRFVSLFFFYLSLIPAHFLVKKFTQEKDHHYIFLSLLLASPIYIFWSRTFMIESLALFGSLFFLWQVAELGQKVSQRPLLLACFAGILAGLTKVTTFGVALPPSLLLFYILSRREESINWKPEPQTIKKLLLVAGIAYVIPLAVSIAWVKYADSIKMLNPIADGHITSDALKNWNYGKWDKKFSLETWRIILESRFPFTLGTISGAHIKTQLILMGLGFLFIPKYRVPAILCFLGFLTGPLVFTNLYKVHDYYWYANSYFVIASVGFLLAGLTYVNGMKWFTRLVIIPGFIALMFSGYNQTYLRIQSHNNQMYEPVAKAIQEKTQEKDIIMIMGLDWSSELAYYAERKAIMVPWRLTLWSDEIQGALKNTGKDSIKALVIAGKRRLETEKVNQRLEYLGMSSQPILRTEAMDLYLRQ